MNMHQKLTGAQRTARYRAAKRAEGMRLKQFWVPDLRNAAVVKEIQRSVAIINESDRRDGTMEYLDSLYDTMMDALPPHDWDEETST